MAAREKVIQALESHILGMQCESCPYHDECDYTEEMPAVLGDALALLKERKPKYHIKIITNGNCTVCGKPLGGDALFLCEECRQKEQEEHHD